MLLYILLPFLVFLLGFVCYKKSRLKRLFLFLAIIILALVFLRFGNIIFATLTVSFPIFLRVLSLLLRNIGFLIPFLKKKQNQTMNSDKKMTKAEAYKILELQKGASKEEIKTQHKKLIKKNHPDLGGSLYIAELINRAKDKLL